MKKTVFILFTIACHHISRGQNTKADPCDAFSLSIIKEGGNNDTARLLYYDCSEGGIDTLLLLNGPVTIRGTVKRATEGVLFTDIHNRDMDGPGVIRFIIEPGQMNVSFSIVNDTVRDKRITGSKSQAEKENWELVNAALLDPYYYNDLVQQYLKYKKDKNAELQKLYKDSIDVFYEKRIEAAIAFIKANPDSYYSGYLLRRYIRRIPLDSIQVYYTSLANRVKQSQLGQEILSEVFARTGDMNFRKQNSDPVFFSRLEKIKSLHDISLADVAGQVHHLSKFKGKYVVVDFWSSGCGPCFANIPYLKKLVEEMKGRQVAFVSVSIDTDVDKWKAAMAQHHFPGLNLVDTAWLAAAYYKVPWVPKYVIINPDGTIAHGDAPHPISGNLTPLLISIMDKKE